jgi:aryl-alcohol dehydrogenase
MLTDALVVKEPGAGFKYQEITVDDNIRDNEVLVKMIATGVCHTDLNFSKEETVPGLFPAVFGHEGTNPRLPNSKFCPQFINQEIPCHNELCS